MYDLAILHLSDLHIDDTGRSYSKPLASLLTDIKAQISSIPDKQLAIVVTGDIINKGNPRAVPNAKKFFQKLKEITDNKVIALYIVPGNHDKKRTQINSYLVPAYRQLIVEGNSTKFNESFEEEVWPQQINTYTESQYLELIDNIYDEFLMPDIKTVAQKTFGVHVLSIGEKNYCFVLLNTAWSCADDSDARRLILGEFQLKSVLNSYRELTDEKTVDMTFVLGHHPIESLFGTEQDELFASMISYNGIRANVYLCGHTHDRKVINWSNNHHAINTLMTGFGWPEPPSDRIHEHYYSIYYFNLALNSMDIYVRRTNDESSFIPDLSIYTGDKSRDGTKLVRPIKYQEAQGAISLSVAKEMPTHITFASTDFLNCSKAFLCFVGEISMESGVVLESYKDDVYESLILPEPISPEERDKYDNLFLECLNDINTFDSLTDEQKNVVDQILKLNQKKIYENFQSYIQWLCQILQEKIVSLISDNYVVRTHFRYLSDKTNATYSPLCWFSGESGDRELENIPSDIKYGDLIEAAFMNPASGCLIYSVNKEICINELNEKWKNFITVVPKFEKNVYTRRKNKTTMKQYPLITFGMTTSDSAFDCVLQCMDYYSMDCFIANLLQSYLDAFMINIDGFLDWMKREDKKET